MASTEYRPTRVNLAPSVIESEKLNRPAKPCMVVTASGMLTGGRVLHHLEHQLPNGRISVVPGTQGRALADGEKQKSRSTADRYRCAEILVTNAYSAHAEAEQMVQWLSAMKPPDTAYVVSGEEDAARALATRLADELGWNAVVLRYLEHVRL